MGPQSKPKPKENLDRQVRERVIILIHFHPKRQRNRASILISVIYQKKTKKWIQFLIRKGHPLQYVIKICGTSKYLLAEELVTQYKVGNTFEAAFDMY